jgi:hypothetical protein
VASEIELVELEVALFAPSVESSLELEILRTIWFDVVND